MASIGAPELVLIFIIALIVFGPRKLPEIGKSLGRMLFQFRRASSDLKRTIEDEVESERLRELTSPIAATTPVEPAASPSSGTSADPATLPGQPPAAGAPAPTYEP